MKLSIFRSLIALAFVGAAAAAQVAAPVAPVTPRDVEPLAPVLVGRDCTPSPCTCNKSPGLFCGNSAVNPNCPSGYVFNCYEDGSTCVYGIRISCAQCGQLAC